MSKKQKGRKQKLAKKNSQSRWAPFWLIPKVFGKRKVHPSRITSVKRNWKRKLKD